MKGCSPCRFRQRRSPTPRSRPAAQPIQLRKLWTFALDGITSASTVPLRVWSYLGGIVALLAIAYSVFVIVRTLVSGVQVPGYASLMVAVLFLGGLQLLSLGILGEYVGRILVESKRRPLYVVREEIGGER